MVDIGSTIGGIGAKISSATKLGILLLLIAGMVSVLAWLFLRWYRYNVTCVIFSRRKGKDFIKIDKGGFFKSLRTNVHYFKLRKNRVILQPPDFRFIGKNKLLFLRQVSMDLFIPMNVDNISESTVNMRTLEQDLNHWMAMRVKEVKEQHNRYSMLKSMLPGIIFFGVTIVIVIAVVWLSKDMSSAGSVMKEAADVLSKVHLNSTL